MKGAVNAFTSDNAFGVGRIESGNSDFRLGQAIGDAVATLTGTVEVLGGGGEAVVTLPATVTGVGALAPAAGVAVVAHGATTATIAGGHLANAALSSMSSDAPSGSGATSAGKPRAPVKAKDAPGDTAGGQATNEHGQKLAPSGRPQINNVSSNTREAARNKANKGSGTVEDRNPTRGQPHFHTKRGTGEKKRDNVHYNYPE